MSDRVPMRGLGLTLWLLGTIAALSLLAAPLEVLRPPGLPVGPLAFRALALINPLLFITVAVPLGCWAAARTGLDAPVVRAVLARRDGWLALVRPRLAAAAIVGLLSALVLWSYARLTAPWFADAHAPDLPLPLGTKLLYGGIVEELITRWGLMSLFVWVAWRVAGARTPVPAGAYWLGAGLSAIVFAAGHLPLLFSLVPGAGGAMVAAVLIGNSLPGLMFGWLLWRRGLEAAMLAHALSHLVYTVASGV